MIDTTQKKENSVALFSPQIHLFIVPKTLVYYSGRKIILTKHIGSTKVYSELKGKVF